jgi:hypothetical protein
MMAPRPGAGEGDRKRGRGRHVAAILRFAVAAGLLGGVTQCAIGQSGCPCGGDPEAPLTEHDLQYAGRHVLTTGCVCQCGADTPVQGPREGDLCPDDGRECVDAAGRAESFACY